MFRFVSCVFIRGVLNWTIKQEQLKSNKEQLFRSFTLKKTKKSVYIYPLRQNIVKSSIKSDLKNPQYSTYLNKHVYNFPPRLTFLFSYNSGCSSEYQQSSISDNSYTENIYLFKDNI